MSDVIGIRLKCSYGVYARVYPNDIVSSFLIDLQALAEIAYIKLIAANFEVLRFELLVYNEDLRFR